MNSAITLRPINEYDSEFLYSVYASTRDDIGLTNWPWEQRDAFLRMQFRAQSTYYQEQFGDAEFLVVLAGDEPIGRFYVDRCPDEIRIIDIALLPASRGNGVGSRILRDLLEEATEARKPIRIHVLRNNAAIHLYDRLGFRKAGHTDVYDLMEWTPGGIGADT